MANKEDKQTSFRMAEEKTRRFKACYSDYYNRYQLEVQLQGEAVLGFVYGQIYTPPAK